MADLKTIDLSVRVAWWAPLAALLAVAADALLNSAIRVEAVEARPQAVGAPAGRAAELIDQPCLWVADDANA